MGQYNPPNAQRWVVGRKAELIAAIRNGDLNLEDACERYALTTDELISWHVGYNRHGLDGLRAMHAPVYRRKLGRTDPAPTV